MAMSLKRYQITAIIYDKRGRVLSVGQNSYVKTHPLQAHHARKAGEPYRQFLHAEVHAIARCPDINQAHTMKIFRFLEDGSPALARPCRICESAIQSTPIKVITHT